MPSSGKHKQTNTERRLEKEEEEINEEENINRQF